MAFTDGGFGSIVGLGGAILGRNWEKSDASKMRNWQEDMRRTAHQTEVEDLKAAGLNPALSAGGTGAPMGQASSPQQVDVAGQIQKGAMARNTAAIATQNEVKAAIDKRKLEVFKDLPQKAKDAAGGAKIATDSGLPAWFGAAAGTLDGIKNLFKIHEPEIPNKYKPGPRVGKSLQKKLWPKGESQYKGGRMINLHGFPRSTKK